MVYVLKGRSGNWSSVETVFKTQVPCSVCFSEHGKSIHVTTKGSIPGITMEERIQGALTQGFKQEFPFLLECHPFWNVLEDPASKSIFFSQYFEKIHKSVLI